MKRRPSVFRALRSTLLLPYVLPIMLTMTAAWAAWWVFVDPAAVIEAYAIEEPLLTGNGLLLLSAVFGLIGIAVSYVAMLVYLLTKATDWMSRQRDVQVEIEMPEPYASAPTSRWKIP